MKDEQLSPDQQQTLDLLKMHFILQDQFEQLTRHVEELYTRTKKLEGLLASKILS